MYIHIYIYIYIYIYIPICIFCIYTDILYILYIYKSNLNNFVTALKYVPSF